MHRLRVAVAFALFLVAASSGPAFADDVPTFADRADDAIEDSDASIAVMFDPLAIACGVFGGEADFVVQRSLAISLDAVGYRPDAATLGAVGAGLLIYPLRSAFHGLYMEPRVVYTHALSQAAVSGPAALVVAGLSGWQWTWDYGLSIRLGVGAAGSTGGLAVRAPELSVGRLALIADAGVGWAW
jgi:hypothetical protein